MRHISNESEERKKKNNHNAYDTDIMSFNAAHLKDSSEEHYHLLPVHSWSI
jgi:hypothetical protein